MAKQQLDAAIGVEDIKEYLSTQDDFALELYVYRQAVALGHEASHGGSYEDPVTKKFRQYDLRVAVHRGNRRVALAIECKSLKASYPLLVSRVPRSPSESFHQFVYSRTPTSGSLAVPGRDVDTGESLEVRVQTACYPIGKHVGKSTAQVGRSTQGEIVSGDSETFDKWSQALASAHSLVSESLGHYKLSSTRSFVTAILPVLVVADGTLWVVDYDDDGNPISSPYQIDETTIYVGREYAVGIKTKFIASHLHIFTRSAIGPFLESLAWSETPWGRIWPPGVIPRDVETT